MMVYILDPSLRDNGGHHFEYDVAIASAARSASRNVVIFAHKSYAEPSPAGIEIVPWFSSHIYEDRRSVLAYGVSNFLHFNFSILKDLKRLQKKRRLGPDDIVIAPTISQNQLFGIVRWAAAFVAAKAPLFVVYLMFSPDLQILEGAAANESGADSEKSMFYRFGFECAAAVEATILFFAGGVQLAREYSKLTGMTIKSHPVPICLDPSKRQNRSDPTTLLFAGVAKREKGFLLLPELAERLSIAHPDHRFLIHVDFGGLAFTQPDMCSAISQLMELAGQRENVVVLTGKAKREEYEALWERSSCLVCTYDPKAYARQTSGVVWEAISIGLPILAPAKTFICREAAEWGAGHVAYSTWSAAGIAAAYSTFYSAIDELSKASREASKRFQAYNNKAALEEHMKLLRKAGPASHAPRFMHRLKQTRLYLILAWLKFRSRPRAHAGLFASKA